MQFNTSKACADHLRTHFSTKYGVKLKATHARELVAAFFGYKSHAALLAEKNYPLSQLGNASVLVPDTMLISQRSAKLNGLPTVMPGSKELAAEIVDFLHKGRFFTGKVWLYASIGEYIVEVFLFDEDYEVTEQLSGIMAETNAYFDETYYEDAEVLSGIDNLSVVATGQLNGANDPDRMFCGDQIDMTVTVELPRVAGRNAYAEPVISAVGQVNDDWVDPEVRYGRSS